MHRHPVAAWVRAAWAAVGVAIGSVGVVVAAAGMEAYATGGVPCANFGRVHPGLYRGAEPDDACLEHLAGLGITMVMNLRDDDEDSGREQARVVALGMRYVNMPLSGLGRPSLEAVRRVVARITDAGNQPVFVHCRRGRDRTGVIIAAFRMGHEGWTAERAIREAEDFGLAWWQFRMKRFMLDFGADVQAAPPGSDTR